MQYETGNKNCFISQVRLILGDRASGVYNASEIFRGAGCWGISQKSAVTVSRFAICIKSRSKNEPSV